jgi:hypothetical protein
MNYDVIADIHGQYLKLLALLQSLGYRKRPEGALTPGSQGAGTRTGARPSSWAT